MCTLCHKEMHDVYVHVHDEHLKHEHVSVRHNVNEIMCERVDHGEHVLVTVVECKHDGVYEI